MAATREEGGTPRAVIHKRILDIAEERPDASMAAIADAVGGATVDLVERVLDEYGDPGGDAGTEPADSGATSDDPGEGEADDGPGPTGDELADDGRPAAGPTNPDADAVLAPDGDVPPGTAADEGVPDATELTHRQLEVLRHVYDHPDASQRELGEHLGVSASTVNNRLSDVPGFEWDDRWRFVRALFGRATDGGVAAADEAAVSELRERVESLEERVEDVATRGEVGDGRGPPLPPELAHKVVHACVASDRLDEEEELAVLRLLMGDDSPE